MKSSIAPPNTCIFSLINLHKLQSMGVDLRLGRHGYELSQEINFLAAKIQFLMMGNKYENKVDILSPYPRMCSNFTHLE